MFQVSRQKHVMIWTGLGALVAAAAASYWLHGDRERAKETEDFRTVRYLVPQPVFTTAPIKPVGKALKSLNPTEMVLGVTVGEEARAYPLNALNEIPSRKVFNDVLGGKPIAVTWCDRCHTGIVYEREMDGRVLTFGISGDLWRDNMVMYDQETRSLWSQSQGEAKRGRWKGRRLRPVPSFLTDWHSWSSQYPRGSVMVLNRSRKEFTRDLYRNPEPFILGIAEGESKKAWSLAELSPRRLINDTWEGRPVLAVFDQASATARLFERTLQGRVLTFRPEGRLMVDEGTGSRWSPVTGRAVDGRLAGRHLVALPASVWYRTGWQRFHS